MDDPIVATTRHLDAPWIAANLAVLNEAALDVRLDVDFHVLAAKRTRDQELVWHFPRSYCKAGQPVADWVRVAPSRMARAVYCLS